MGKKGDVSKNKRSDGSESRPKNKSSGKSDTKHSRQRSNELPKRLGKEEKEGKVYYEDDVLSTNPTPKPISVSRPQQHLTDPNPKPRPYPPGTTPVPKPDTSSVHSNTSRSMHEQMQPASYASSNYIYNYTPVNEATNSQLSTYSTAYSTNNNSTAAFGSGYNQNEYGMADNTATAYTPRNAPIATYEQAFSRYEEEPTVDMDETKDVRKQH